MQPTDQKQNTDNANQGKAPRPLAGRYNPDQPRGRATMPMHQRNGRPAQTRATRPGSSWSSGLLVRSVAWHRPVRRSGSPWTRRARTKTTSRYCCRSVGWICMDGATGEAGGSATGGGRSAGAHGEAAPSPLSPFQCWLIVRQSPPKEGAGNGFRQ